MVSNVTRKYPAIHGGIRTNTVGAHNALADAAGLSGADLLLAVLLA